jgi:hypothetical protein
VARNFDNHDKSWLAFRGTESIAPGNFNAINLAHSFGGHSIFLSITQSEVFPQTLAEIVVNMENPTKRAARQPHLLPPRATIFVKPWVVSFITLGCIPG